MVIASIHHDFPAARRTVTRQRLINLPRRLQAANHAHDQAAPSRRLAHAVSAFSPNRAARGSGSGDFRLRMRRRLISNLPQCRGSRRAGDSEGFVEQTAIAFSSWGLADGDVIGAVSARSCAPQSCAGQRRYPASRPSRGGAERWG